MAKMDAKLVSTKKTDQNEYELKYISKKFKVGIKIVRRIAEDVGVSRQKIYDELFARGYTHSKMTMDEQREALRKS